MDPTPSHTDGSTETPTPSSVNTAQGDSQTDKRIRDLMSAKDRAVADTTRAQQRLLEMQQEVEARGTLLHSATQTTEQLLKQKQQLETERTQLAAELMKLKVLSQYPDLLPYAEFLPVTSDEAQMKDAITRFQQVRSLDLSKAAVPPSPSPLDGPRPAVTTPLVPPTPPPAPSAPSPADSQEAARLLHQRITRINPLDPNQRDQWEELIKEAERQAQQQFQR